MIKKLVAILSLSILSACANQTTGLTMYQLESDKYLLTYRNRLPIDFPDIQKNLFKHESVCHEKYTFKMAKNESAYAYVIYQPEGTTGLEDAVVISVVLLHDRSTNMKAYSYYPGNMDRVHRMLTAIMEPDNCGIDTSWENAIGKDE